MVTDLLCASQIKSRAAEKTMTNLVVTGISGRFPEASNIDELWKNLVSNVDMVTENDQRWPSGFFGLPRRMGIIPDLERFDAAFFNIPSCVVGRMDPQIRKLLEVTYEAFVDSGVHPECIRKSDTGVFIGSTSNDAVEMMSHHLESVTGYELLGAIGTMISNRISFTFDLRGPSMLYNSGCSSSLLALNEACRSLKSGVCSAAVIGGSNAILNPAGTLFAFRMQTQSLEGKCKAFDASVDGYVRSEAVVVLHLQMQDVALRKCATILHSKSNVDGFKEEGISHPSSLMLAKLLEETYTECGVSPMELSYLECHGTGTRVGDVEELNGVFASLCKRRCSTNKLLIGSIKTNLGHTEGAAAPPSPDLQAF